MAEMSALNVFQAAGSAMSLFGASQGADAARANAAARQAASNFSAEQLDIMAGQQTAAAQRVAAEQRRQALLVQSRALAVAAAGGGGVTDPTVVKLTSKIAGEGAYRSAVALYEGEDRARTLRMKAAAARYEGDAAIMSGEAQADAYAIKGFGDALKGGFSLFSKYGGSGPNGPAGSAGDSALIGDFDSNFA